MHKIKKIFNKVFLLLLDVALLTFQTLKQVVLPNKKRKGNILSSLLIFFIGIIETLDHFEHGIFKVIDIFKLKYLKQSVFLIATFLFFLSSFEWKVNPELNVETCAITSLQLSTSTKNTASVNKQIQSIYTLDKAFFSHSFPEYKNTFPYSDVSQSSLKKYLSTRRLRI